MIVRAAAAVAALAAIASALQFDRRSAGTKVRRPPRRELPASALRECAYHRRTSRLWLHLTRTSPAILLQSCLHTTHSILCCFCCAAARPAVGSRSVPHQSLHASFVISGGPPLSSLRRVQCLMEMLSKHDVVKGGFKVHDVAPGTPPGVTLTVR